MRELLFTAQLADDYRLTNLSKTLDAANMDDLVGSIPLRVTFESPLGDKACRALFRATDSAKLRDADLDRALLDAMTAKDSAHRWSLTCVSINAHGLRLQFLDIETGKSHEYCLHAGKTSVVLRIHTIDRTGKPQVYTYHEHMLKGQHLIGVQEPQLGEAGVCRNLSFTLSPRGDYTEVTVTETI